MIPNCAATRHAHFVLDGSGPVELEAPSLSDWPAVTWTPDAKSRKVDLDKLTRQEVASWKPGERLEHYFEQRCDRVARADFVRVENLALEVFFFQRPVFVADEPVAGLVVRDPTPDRRVEPGMDQRKTPGAVFPASNPSRPPSSLIDLLRRP